MESQFYFECVHRYMKYKTFHEDLPKNQHDTIRKAARHFLETGDRLFFQDRYGRQRLALTTLEQQEKALFESHNEKNHCGITKTLNSLEMAYYWKTMVKDVKNWIKLCDRCQKMEKLKTVSKQLHPIVTEEPWQIIGIDLTGPLPTTEEGNKYIFTATDLYSKFVFARPLKNKTAEEVCNVTEDLFFTYGPPRKIITDQGREFVNKMNAELFGKWGVKHSVTAPYSPEGNGQDENTNGNIKRILRKYVNEHQNNWDKYIKQVVYGINTSYQETIKRTPFKVMFQRDILLPMYLNIINEISFKEQIEELEELEENSTAMFSCSPDKEGDHTYSKKMETPKEVIEQLPFYQEVQECIATAQQKQKRQYEAKNSKGVVSFDFHPGQEVLKRNSKKDGRKGGKLEDDWLGPYVIERILLNGHVELKNKNGTILKTKCSIRHLKPYLRKHLQLEDPNCEIVGSHEPQHRRRPISCTVPQESSNHHNFLEDISNGEWLQDTHMNYAGTLLSQQFPDIIIQPTTVIAAGSAGALVGTPEGKFVQPVHVNQNHWVCISNINCQEGTVKIYDSMSPSELDADLQQAISWLLFCSKPRISVEWPAMTQQIGGSDCGLFSLAVATSLCFEQDPSSVEYDQSQLRPHLTSCFLRKSMSVFPSKKKPFFQQFQ